jgi:DnaA regulatory inactivator Hda
MVMHEGIQEAVSAIRSVYAAGKVPVPSLFLHGPAGTGKTHILRALVTLLDEVFSEHGLSARFVEPMGDEPSFPDLERLATEDGTILQRICAVIVDNVHLVQGADCAHLWSLSNKVTRLGAPLIMGSRTPPDKTFSHDPHLHSRIVSGLVFGLEPPEDAVRLLILDKMARDRNVRISPDVTKYLITRKSRNINELNKLLDVLDRASLQMKRRITVPLIKMLEKQGDL